MQRSETLDELAKAMAAAQADMKAAEMNATNPFLHNRYADLGSIIEAVRPAIGKHGLSFAQMPTFNGETVTVETLIMHSSGQWLASDISLSIEGEKGLSQAQVMGKAITYLRRYGLSAMFGVYADKDEDGNGSGGDSGQRSSEQRTTTTATTSAAASSVSTGPVPNCPKCGGAMWDNRQKKAAGDMKPNAPDFKCKKEKDANCDGAVWPKKDAAQPPAEHPKTITEEQLTAIQRLAGMIYPKPEDKTRYRAWLKNEYKVDAAKDLTFDQAIKVINALNEVAAIPGDGQDELPL